MVGRTTIARAIRDEAVIGSFVGFWDSYVIYLSQCSDLKKSARLRGRVARGSWLQNEQTLYDFKIHVVYEVVDVACNVEVVVETCRHLSALRDSGL